MPIQRRLPLESLTVLMARMRLVSPLRPEAPQQELGLPPAAVWFLPAERPIQPELALELGMAPVLPEQVMLEGLPQRLLHGADLCLRDHHDCRFCRLHLFRHHPCRDDLLDHRDRVRDHGHGRLGHRVRHDLFAGAAGCQL